uniref:Uncharacterized protein n=1 Tax=Mucochytrium quahogii TaxID=96639 RepID=A0A7S2WHU3_9STRA|mmetsp:Transcript_45279/g.72660  ORF Transcript_45279/g.72660 Transcript_45279/m.72660 type:complete len:399 (+) Transcript_45279:316-1512(+)
MERSVGGQNGLNNVDSVQRLIDMQGEQFEILKNKHEKSCAFLLNELDRIDLGSSQKLALKNHLTLMKEQFSTDLEATETLVSGSEKTMQVLSQYQQNGNGVPDQTERRRSFESLLSVPNMNVSTPESTRSTRKEASSLNYSRAGKKSQTRYVRNDHDEEDFLVNEEDYYHDQTFSRRGRMVGRVVDELSEELKWIDEHAIKARIESEKRLMKLLESLAARVAMLEIECERNRKHSGGTEKPTSGEISPELEKRLSYLEGLAKDLEKQGSLVQKLADRVQESVGEITETMQSQHRALENVQGSGFPSPKLSPDQLEFVKKIVSNGTGALEKDMKRRVKKGIESLETGRKIENARLENQLSDALARVEILESRVTDDHEQTIQILEMLLQDQKGGRSQRR